MELDAVVVALTKRLLQQPYRSILVTENRRDVGAPARVGPSKERLLQPLKPAIDLQGGIATAEACERRSAETAVANVVGSFLDQRCDECVGIRPAFCVVEGLAAIVPLFV